MDSSPDDLIKLLRINQHSAILIDSDRKEESDELNATKTRVVEECKEAGVLCWLSAGREIENYVTPECVSAAYDKIVGKKGTVVLGAYQKLEDAVEEAYQSDWRAGYAYDTDKPAFARLIAAETGEVPDRLDLKERLSGLVAAIRAAG